MFFSVLTLAAIFLLFAFVVFSLVSSVLSQEEEHL